MNLDSTDKEILKILQINSELTTKQLADRIHLSATPVYERVKKMEREGYIKKYVAIVDKEKIGKGLMVFTNIRLKQHTRDIGNDFVQRIREIPEIIECHNISGDYDFMLKVIVTDMKHYQNFVMNVLGGLDSIGAAHSIFVIGEIKSTTEVAID